MHKPHTHTKKWTILAKLNFSTITFGEMENGLKWKWHVCGINNLQCKEPVLFSITHSRERSTVNTFIPISSDKMHTVQSAHTSWCRNSLGIREFSWAMYSTAFTLYVTCSLCDISFTCVSLDKIYMPLRDVARVRAKMKDWRLKRHNNKKNKITKIQIETR